MRMKQKIVFVAFSFGFLIFLLLVSATPATQNMSNHNVFVRARRHPLSLRMLAKVVRYCEENDKPMHPGIIRWASASMTTDANQFTQTDSSTSAGLFTSQ